MYIATHTSPDFDAIAAVALLQEFDDTLEVKFVNTGQPDPAILTGAAFVVDTGRIFDPAQGRFDHHQLPGLEANSTCATLQVYNWLLETAGGDWREWLLAIKPLVDLIYQGDTGQPEANYSRELGIHALLSSHIAYLRERKLATDLLIYEYGRDLFAFIAARLVAKAKAKKELDSKVSWQSPDGLLWAIEGGTTASTFAAFDEGAWFVVFVAEPVQMEDGSITYPVGLSRAQECTVNGGEIVKFTLSLADSPVAEELASWYLHPAGFFCGRGTPKAPSLVKPIVTAEHLAERLDLGWSR